MTTQKQLPSILIVGNGETSRLDIFKPLFEALVKQGIGKLNESRYCVRSDIHLQAKNETEFLFNNIQMKAQMQGMESVCYCFSI